jgi:hypothetical protein
MKKATLLFATFVAITTLFSCTESFGQTKWKDFLASTPEFIDYGKTYKIDDYKNLKKISTIDAKTFFGIEGDKETYLLGKMQYSGNYVAFLLCEVKDSYKIWTSLTYDIKDKKHLCRWDQVLIAGDTNPWEYEGNFKILKGSDGIIEIQRNLPTEKDYFKMTREGSRDYNN